MLNRLDHRATAKTRRRYDRIAWIYDFMERNSERRFKPWRAALWSRVRGPRVLEVGVGTGKNMPYYPAKLEVTAIDLSPKMLAHAKTRAKKEGVPVKLEEADVQALPFGDTSFDTIVTTFVFCSVPDPLLGLSELKRVLVPGGQLIMLEHVLSKRPFLRRLMQFFNPLVVTIMGANINRETTTTIERAGFAGLRVENLWLDLVKLIEATAPGGKEEEQSQTVQ
ncbi:MAG TPA: methyltransferase domain-containing protein [Chloroflexia bacterium]|nr:methyltransferase domain-containing protein [Chloroflexia bacterium]